jgi:hypothetical protein
MTRQEELVLWKKRIKISRDIREQYITDWIYWQNMFDDNMWSKYRATKQNSRLLVNPIYSAVQVNELESIIMSMLPQIDFHTPIFEVETNVDSTSEMLFSSLVYEFYALRLFEILKMFFKTRDIVFDTLLLGGGVHKTGIAYQVEQNTTDNNIFDELPISTSVSPTNILWDTRFDSWDGKLWIAEEIVKPLEVIKDSDLYEHTSDLKPNLSSYEDAGLMTAQDYGDDKDMVRIVEIHDLYNHKLMTVSLNHEEFLRYDDDYQTEIYDRLEFTPSAPRRFWGKSIVQSLEEHLVRLSKMNQYMDNDSSAVGRQIYLVDSAIGNEQIKQLESSQSRVIIPVDGLNAMSQDPIRQLNLTPKTFNWTANILEIERTIRLLSGSTMQERGAHEPGVETAQEANMLAEKSSVRNNDRALMLSFFIQEVMSKMLRLSSDFIRPERIAEIVGIPVELGYRIQPFDRMKLSVKFGSTAIESRQTYLNKLLMLAQLFPQSLNQTELIQRVMNALGFGIRDIRLLSQQVPQATSETPPKSVAGGEGAGASGSAPLPSTNNPF